MLGTPVSQKMARGRGTHLRGKEGINAEATKGRYHGDQRGHCSKEGVVNTIKCSRSQAECQPDFSEWT